MKKLLVSLSILGLVASVVAGREMPSLELAAPVAARAEAPVLDLSRLERPADEGAKVDLFAAPEATPGKAASGKGVQAASPEKAGPPPLPFAYLGKMIEDGKLAVFLSRGGESYSVAPGDTIGGEYRVDAVNDREITFTYLPLKAKQRLPL